MIDDDVVSGEVPDDSPWRPGADVRFDHAPIRPFEVLPGDPAVDAQPGVGQGSSTHSAPAPSAGTGPGRPGAGRRGVLAGVLVVALVMVGAAVVGRGGTDAPAGEVEGDAASAIDEATDVLTLALRDLGGDVALAPGDAPLVSASQCPPQRLPLAVDPLWDVELPDARRIVSPVTVGDDAVVAVVGFDEPTANGLGSVSIVALDLDDGQERWRAELQPATGRHEIVGIADGAVIVRTAAGPDMAYRRLFAFDEDSGTVLWGRGFRGDWSATVQATTGLVYVGVRRPAVSATEESEVEVLDPRTGDRRHVAAGAFLGVDPDGRLITRIGDEVRATSTTDRDLLGVVDPGESPFTVVGSQVIVADEGANELSVFSGDAAPRAFPLVGSTGIDRPGVVVSLDSIGGTSLLVHGGGAVHGAQVGDGAVELRWRVMGVVVESAATDRGRSLLVATEGGAKQRVIDSSTGRTIVDLELRPGAFTTLALVGNGVVAQSYVGGEAFRVAFDLDGRERWSLPGSGSLAVGHGVVVDVDDSDAVIRVSAAGEPGTPDAGCDDAASS